MKKKKQPDKLITKKALHCRGWHKDQIYQLLPKPAYIDGIPFWKLSDVEKVESSICFYIGVK